MRYYLLFVLLLSQLSNAQLKKTFYGVSFSTSKEQAKALLTSQKISFKEEPSCIVIYSANIGDYFFTKATMFFIEEHFRQISFYKQYQYPYHNKAAKLFKDLHQDLSRKYSILKKIEREGPLYFSGIFSDDSAFTTQIVAYGKKGNVKLSYCYSTLYGEILLDYYDDEYLNTEKVKPFLRNEL